MGVGRGVSPFELKYHKIEHDDSRDIFIDAFNCVSAGLTTKWTQAYQATNIRIATESGNFLTEAKHLNLRCLARAPKATPPPGATPSAA